MNRPDVWVARVAMRIAIDAWRKRQTTTMEVGALPEAVPPEVRQLWARWELEELAPTRRATILLRHLEETRVTEASKRDQGASANLKTSDAARRMVHVLIGKGHGSDG
jgi:DNA-directed RNA polymerase specialized sigma24 family protein